MKNYTIVGIQENSGVLKSTNRPWHNFTLFCTVEDDRSITGLTGSTVDSFKVSDTVINNFVEELGSDNILGCICDVRFERRFYNGVEKFVVSNLIPL